jgi:hypothetical protein
MNGRMTLRRTGGSKRLFLNERSGENRLTLLRHALIIFCLLAGIPAATGCAAQPSNRPWAQADLRWLGGADAPTPSTELLAVYTHTFDLTTDIRLDLLDINPGDAYQVEISLWDNRSFSQEPLRIDLLPDGGRRVSGDEEGKPSLWPRIVQDYDLDTITISLNRFLIGNRYRINVATYTLDPLTPADEVTDIRSDGPAPSARAPMALALWNTYPAVTPAQALRRWDGAHTGPLGGRDGLRYVLDASAKYHIPVALLDLKKPDSLAALNYMEMLWQPQSMSNNGLLILPDVAYAEPVDASLQASRKATEGFGPAGSQFVYDPTGNFSATALDGYTAEFIRLPDPSHLAFANGRRLIPLPQAEAVEATESGPSLGVRRALVKAMLSPDPADLVVLGGDLPRSVWGMADMVAPTFKWIAAHAWIEPLDGNGLMAFPIGGKYAPTATVAQPASALEADLRAAPANAASELAWLDYLSLNEQDENPQLDVLKGNYLGQVRELLRAATWAEKPTEQSECRTDLDEDGQVECILANQDYFAILDPAGARLSNLFHLDAEGVHQLIGPTSQFALGLSDPSEWHPEAGEAADPSVIPGAFTDGTDPWTVYSVEASPGRLRFTSPDGKRVKIFRLTEAGLEVDYQSDGEVTTRIPLAVDPQAFYSKWVRYRPAAAPDSWTWGPENGTMVQVQTQAQLTAEGFVSSYPFLSMPEDPNLDYPRGHYMPFPLSIVTITGEGEFSVQIMVK